MPVRTFGDGLAITPEGIVKILQKLYLRLSRKARNNPDPFLGTSFRHTLLKPCI
jgi:hypothetical protein